MPDKKELKAKYKQMKPEMGVFAIRDTQDRKYYLEATNDLKGTMNSTRFRLGIARHPALALQKDWSEQGENAFVIEILDRLDYDEKEPDKNYSDDLNTLLDIWKKKLSEEKHADFY